MKKITIIGCGHGGQALAADLSLRGCTVSLYAHPNHPGGINAIAKAKGVTCTGLINGFVPIAKATCDMQTAVTDSEYIFIALPSYTHEAIFMELLPFIKPGQTIVTLAANFASLVCLKLLSRADKLSGIDIIDMGIAPSMFAVPIIMALLKSLPLKNRSLQPAFLLPRFKNMFKH